MTRKLNSMPYAQATVIDNGSANRKLISYTTCVAEVNDGWLTVHGLYSATTRKHIGAFMKEFGETYQTAKRCFEEGIRLNLFSGEACGLDK